MDINELFNKYQDDEDKIREILLTSFDDKEKFEALKFLSDERQRRILIHCIYDEDLLVKAMDYLKSEVNKLMIAHLLSGDGYKIMAIKKLEKEVNKVSIAETLHGGAPVKGYTSTDDMKEFLVLPDLQEIRYRISLINTFSNEERKNQLIQEELSNFPKKASILLEQAQEFAKQNILDLPKNLTIGIELEANGLTPEDASVFFKQLTGLKPDISEWEIKKETSLIHGSEITSPILNSSPKNIEDLYFVAEVMKMLHFEPGVNCGGHIHLGASFFEQDENGKSNIDFRNECLQTLLTIWGEAEELFFKMSNSENDVTRDGAVAYAGSGRGFAASIGPTIKKYTDSHGMDFQAAFEEISMNRYSSVNLLNICPEGPNTIEFRLSNSTLEPIEILHNIYLYGRLMVVSKDICLHPEKYKIKFNNFMDPDLSEAEKVEALLDLLFENESQMDIYRRRWQSVRESEIYRNLKLEQPTFKRGDYSLKKEIRNVADGVYPSKISEAESIFTHTRQDKAK